MTLVHIGELIDCWVGSACFARDTVKEKKNYLQRKMGASLVPVLIFTLLWIVVGVVLPIFVPKDTNRGYVFFSWIKYLNRGEDLIIERI